MADPTPYQPGYDYSDHEASNPTLPKPGGQLDNDFANLQRTTDELIAALKDIRRSDGKLKTQIVDVDNFAPGLLARIFGLEDDMIGVEGGVQAYSKVLVALVNALADDPIADKATAEAGEAADKLMTPLRVKQHVSAQIGSAIQAHSGTLDGLSAAIASEPIANQEEAEVGTAANRLMTPQRTAQAMSYFADKSIGRVLDFYNPSKKIDIVAGVLRQRVADRTQWAWINDGVHRPAGFDPDPNFFASDGTTRLNPYTSGVSLLAYWKKRTDALRINAASEEGYENVISCIVAADERLTYDWGIMLGAKVTRTGIVINGSMHKSRHGRIYYNGSTWVTATDSDQPAGTMTASYNSTTGILTVTHDWLPGQQLQVTPDSRLNNLSNLHVPVRDGVASDGKSFTVKFLNPDGTTFTGAPSNKMSFSFTKTYNGRVWFDGSNGWDNIPWSDNGTDDGNIWVFGIMQRA